MNKTIEREVVFDANVTIDFKAGKVRHPRKRPRDSAARHRPISQQTSAAKMPSATTSATSATERFDSGAPTSTPLPALDKSMIFAEYHSAATPTNSHLANHCRERRDLIARPAPQQEKRNHERTTNDC